MPLYALISDLPAGRQDKNSIQKVAAFLPKTAILSLSKKVVVFKAKKLPKLKGKLVRIFQEYPLSEAELYKKAIGLEEIKAIIIDKIFKDKDRSPVSFGLSFYDFDYLKPEFKKQLVKEVKEDLAKLGIKTKYKKQGEIEIVVIKKSSPPLAIYLGKTEKIW